MGWLVDIRVENTADVNTSSAAERRLLSSVLKEYAAGVPLCLRDLPNKNTNIGIHCVNSHCSRLQCHLSYKFASSVLHLTYCEVANRQVLGTI